MVTFEQLLVKYVYQHKKVSLQGFGTVVLNAAIPDFDLIHKNKHLPVEGISFQHDPKAVTDEKFIEFFSQHRGKIKPLALSDIESHLQLAKQLMNIGKPYEVEGLGMFAMDKNGQVVFTPGNYTVPLSDTQGQQSRLKERTEVQEKIESETSSSALSNSTKRLLLTIALILVLIVGGWWAWSKFFATPQDPNAATVIADSIAAADSSALLLTDTSSQAVPATVAPPTTDPNAPVKWKAFFRTFDNKDVALERLNFYKTARNPPLLETTDSVNFRMYVIVESAIADTARKLDSLKRFYARPVTLERQLP
jgi:hypothetical protein